MSVDLRHGNCLDVLPTLPDCSVDSIVTDPPYELGFMGKKWDASGIAYNVELWQECLRVLKPGGHLLAFGGTRTYHRMACAIEDAGFEIRDSIHWLYGSGFPKSLDVSKAIDKAAGAEREIIGTRSTHLERPITSKWDKTLNRTEAGSPFGDYPLVVNVTAPATDAARQWEGWGTALKPAHEPIVVARKPLVGTVAGNVLAYGTGALNIDASRIGYQSEDDKTKALAGDAFKRKDTSDKGWSRPWMEDQERIDQINREAKERVQAGRWPANVVFSHHEDCQQIGVREDEYQINRLEEWSGFGQKERPDYEGAGRSVQVGVWECVAGCPVQQLDQQTGYLKPATSRTHRVDRSPFSTGEGQIETHAVYQDGGGGASRFFYCAKPSRRERNAGLDHLDEKTAGEATDRKDGSAGLNSPRAGAGRTGGATNHHPTVKPLALMRYLVRLVTPPNGTVLEPFAGSGTTLMACILENFNAIGIEMTDEYLPIIEGRINWAYEEAAKESPQQELEL